MGILHRIFGNPEIRILELTDAHLEQLTNPNCSQWNRKRLLKLLRERKGRIIVKINNELANI